MGHKQSGGVLQAPSFLFFKAVSYFVAVGVGLLAVAPAIQYQIPVMVNTFSWLYAVVAAGLFGFFLLKTKLPGALKVLTVYLFVSCFFSQVPYVSFNALLVIVPTLYFFLLAEKCDFRIIVRMLEAVFWLEVAFIVLQAMGKDTLMNWDFALQLDQSGNVIPVNDKLVKPVFFGTVFQYMRASSLFACLTPFLLLRSWWYAIPIAGLLVASQSSSFALALFLGGAVYFMVQPIRFKWLWIALMAYVAGLYALYDHASFQVAFSCGRIPVWGDIVKTWVFDTLHARPAHLAGPVVWKQVFFGHGLDTFLPMFPLYKHDINPFPQAHNDWLQMLWEIGAVGFGIVAFYCWGLLKRLHKAKLFGLIAGLVVLGVNMFFAFPGRMTQTILIMVGFLALCEQSLKGEI